MSLSSALRGGERKVKSFAQDRERSCHLTSNLFHNLFLTVWNESAFDENTLDHLESNYTLVYSVRDIGVDVTQNKSC